MTANTNNGGPAFPTRGTVIEAPQSGMSLRDYFAAGYQPDISKITSVEADAVGVPFPVSPTTSNWMRWRAEIRAKLRYIEADAMLRARENTNDR